MKSFFTEKIQSFRNKLTPKGIILMYHRVEKIDYDPWNLAVSPKNFEEHLKVLQKRNLGISLKKLAERHQQKKLGFNSLALTFDDGYSDNYRNARPLLEKYSIPATFFIATGYIDQEKEFWWDELENILFATPLLQGKIQVIILGKNYSWDFSNNESQHPDYHENLKSWRVDSEFNNARQNAFLDLWTLIKPLSPNHQENIMVQLRKCSIQKPREQNFPMTSNQLLEMAGNNLFCFGAHTCSHCSLPALNAESQSVEISGSITTLEKLLKRRITTFAYPYGDYSETTEILLQEQKISVACTTEFKSINIKENLLSLPRFQVMDWSGEEFEYQLNIWFNHLHLKKYYDKKKSSKGINNYLFL